MSIFNTIKKWAPSLFFLGAGAVCIVVGVADILMGAGLLPFGGVGLVPLISGIFCVLGGTYVMAFGYKNLKQVIKEKRDEANVKKMLEADKDILSSIETKKDFKKNPSKYNAQAHLFTARKTLGFSSPNKDKCSEGLCNGVAILGIEYFLKGKLAIFDEKIALADDEKLPKRVKKLREIEFNNRPVAPSEKGKEKISPLSEKLKNTHSLRKFFVKMEKYQEDAQRNLDKIKQKKLIQLRKYRMKTGLYTLQRLTAFFNDINDICVKDNKNIALQLATAPASHAIALCYDASKNEWRLIDANSLPSCVIKPEDIAANIFSALNTEQNQLLSMETVMYTLSDHLDESKQLWRQIKSSQGFQAAHRITPEIANCHNKRGATLAHAAASAGDVKTIKTLAGAKADFNKSYGWIRKPDLAAYWYYADTGYSKNGQKILKTIAKNGGDLTKKPLFVFASTLGMLSMVHKKPELAGELIYSLIRKEKDPAKQNKLIKKYKEYKYEVYCYIAKLEDTRLQEELLRQSVENEGILGKFFWQQRGLCKPSLESGTLRYLNQAYQATQRVAPDNERTRLIRSATI